MRRAFPGVNWEQSQRLITRIFDNTESFRRLCLVSGGHVRNLLRLICSCMDREDPPISSKCLEKVIKEEQNSFLSIDNKEWDLLRQIAKQKYIGGEQEDQDEYNRFIRHLLVFE